MMKASAGSGVVTARSRPSATAPLHRRVQVGLDDVGASLVDDVDGGGVHVDTDDLIAVRRQDGGGGQADVPEADDADPGDGQLHAHLGSLPKSSPDGRTIAGTPANPTGFCKNRSTRPTIAVSLMDMAEA